MKKEERISLPATGGSSLLVIFALVCLVVFALLSLNTVLAEKRLSEAHAQAAKDWYGADLKAQEIFARLRAGEAVAGVEQSGTEYAYSVPISQHQTLLVTLQKNSDGWEVLSWQTMAHPEDGDTTLPVWQGPEGER